MALGRSPISLNAVTNKFTLKSSTAQCTVQCALKVVVTRKESWEAMAECIKLRLGPEMHYQPVWARVRVRISWTGNARSSLASENNGVAQTGVTLFYTINPFGPSAGRVSRCMSGCMFVILSCRSEITMKGGVWGSNFFLNNLMDWLRGCANLCLEEIRPVEVPLRQMWSKNFALFLLMLLSWRSELPSSLVVPTREPLFFIFALAQWVTTT